MIEEDRSTGDDEPITLDLDQSTIMKIVSGKKRDTTKKRHYLMGVR